MMEKNKTKIITIASLLALVILIVGATYAYFVAQTGEGSQTDIKINANTVDTLTFETGKAISISMDQENFAEGKGNKTGTTFATAILTANNKTNTATDHYYMYLDIELNTFTYTQNEEIPEILLTIKDTSNNEITNINGLTYKTVTDGNGSTVTGFDITTKDELITIFENREITTTSSITEKWNVIITFINYNKDQSANAGKVFNAKLKIQKDEMPNTIADVCTNGDNFNECLLTLGENGSTSVTKLYYHDSNLINSANDKSYRYSGGDFVLTEEAKKEGYKLVTSFQATTDSPKYLIGCYDKESEFIYNNKHFYKADGITYRDVVETVISDGYLINNRINNFVCFGSDASPCPTDNLYRIIGIFDGKIKMIKYEIANSSLLGTDGANSCLDGSGIYTGGYKGNNEISSRDDGYSWVAYGYHGNDFSQYSLTAVNLNTNYLNNIGSDWANKIDTHTWKFISMNGSTYAKSLISPYNLYMHEINEASVVENYNAKVNLMNASDYAYASAPTEWTTGNIDFMLGKVSESFVDSNWLFMGIGEFLLNYAEFGNNNFMAVSPTGGILFFHNQSTFVVRPTFYLSESVNYLSGDGSQENPIRID